MPLLINNSAYFTSADKGAFFGLKKMEKSLVRYIERDFLLWTMNTSTFSTLKNLLTHKLKWSELNSPSNFNNTRIIAERFGMKNKFDKLYNK